MESAERGKESDIGVEKRTASRASKGAKRYRFGPFAAGILFFFFCSGRRTNGQDYVHIKKMKKKKWKKDAKKFKEDCIQNIYGHLISCNTQKTTSCMLKKLTSLKFP